MENGEADQLGQPADNEQHDTAFHGTQCSTAQFVDPADDGKVEGETKGMDDDGEYRQE